MFFSCRFIVSFVLGGIAFSFIFSYSLLFLSSFYRVVLSCRSLWEELRRILGFRKGENRIPKKLLGGVALEVFTRNSFFNHKRTNHVTSGDLGATWAQRAGLGLHFFAIFLVKLIKKASESKAPFGPPPLLWRSENVGSRNFFAKFHQKNNKNIETEPSSLSPGSHQVT